MQELDRTLDRLRRFIPADRLRAVTAADSNSNDVRFLEFEDGRTLIAKEPRFPELSGDLLAERTASRLLRDHPDVLAPEHLPVDDGDDAPLVAYWLIPHPTLEKVWPTLTETRRAATLRSWGRLMRRLHDMRLPGHGRLPEALHGTGSLGDFLADDLEGRLRPAVQADWPDAIDLIDRLIDAVPSVVGRIADRDPVLVHGDLFAANVLCSWRDGAPQCVGVIDLEDAMAGPPEADLAKTEILHGPLFGRSLPAGWFDHVLEGYGPGPDPRARAFFRAWHMVNMAYHEAITCPTHHVVDLVEAADREIGAAAPSRYAQ